MKYGSVCSGIEAASVAWAPLGWSPAFFAEIERFPCEVLAERHGSNLPGEPLSRNAPPNLGDMTKFQEWPDADINVLVGGTPCQAFSVAGLRKGLADPRGNLALTYLAILDRYRPEWMVWENVPGVLSSSDGRDFGAFLGGVGELGYGFAYRVLDAQYVRVDGFGRAVPQRRRRVFVVGHSSDWRRAAAVLFERESLSGHSAPRRKTGQGIAIGAPAGAAFGGGNRSGAIDAAACLTAHGHRIDFEVETFIAARDVGHALRAQAQISHREDQDNLVAHTLKAEGFDAGEDGTGRGTPLVPVCVDVSDTLSVGANQTTGFPSEVVAFDTTQVTSALNRSVPKAGDPCHPLAAGAHPPAIAIQAGALRENPSSGPDGIGVQEGISYTLEARSEVQAVASGWAVRRLTPLECERLQGFPAIHKELRVIVCEEENSAPASSAKSVSPPQRPEQSAPVAVHVRIDCERMAVEIHRAGRLLWSASGAEHPSSSPLSMPADAFARLVVAMTATSEPQTQLGREASPSSTKSSSPLESGSASVRVFGREIAEHASDAARFMQPALRCSKSTTSQSGQNSQSSDWSLQTSSSCAVHAIASFIPEQMKQASSYTVTFETVEGYTAITRTTGKPAADGPRYKALGNSMAVNVMRWIGRRIEMVDAMTREIERENAA